MSEQTQLEKSNDLENRVLSQVRNKGAIVIKPYVDPEAPNSVGLEKYGMVIFPKAAHTEPLIFTSNGTRRAYRNGLDETADSVKSIANEKQREAKIKSIRETVAYMEKMVNYNNLDPKDPEFWNKVKTFRPDNTEYYKEMKLKLDNDDIPLFPENDIEHLSLVIAILNNGFYSVAPDLDTCKRLNKKWYLSIENDIAQVEVVASRRFNKAKVALEELFDEGSNRLVYVSKILLSEASKFKLSSNRDAVYHSIDSYLDGMKTQKDKLKAADRFSEILAYEPEELMCRAAISDAYIFRIFSTNKNGVYYKKTNQFLGSNTNEVVETLLEPQNQEIYDSLITDLKERYW